MRVSENRVYGIRIYIYPLENLLVDPENDQFIVVSLVFQPRQLPGSKLIYQRVIYNGHVNGDGTKKRPLESGDPFFSESPTSLYRILVLAKRRVAGTFIIPATLRLARTRIRFSVGCV